VTEPVVAGTGDFLDVGAREWAASGELETVVGALPLPMSLTTTTRMTNPTPSAIKTQSPLIDRFLVVDGGLPGTPTPPADGEGIGSMEGSFALWASDEIVADHVSLA
jgi:hypothetical protein